MSSFDSDIDIYSLGRFVNCAKLSCAYEHDTVDCSHE